MSEQCLAVARDTDDPEAKTMACKLLFTLAASYPKGQEDKALEALQTADALDHFISKPGDVTHAHGERSSPGLAVCARGA